MRRMKILGKKMKLGWNMCNDDDYIKINRCYKCSKFNHRAQECKGELTCPICAENHSLQECKASKEQYKCINCTNFNKYIHKSPINAKHSSLDNSCSCYQNMLRRFNETMVTGHGLTRSYRRRLKIIPNSTCSCVLNEEQTIKHIILSCTQLENERKILRSAIVRAGDTWPPLSN